MAKFSDEIIRFLKSEEDLTWKVPDNYKTKECGENVTVHYHRLLMKFKSRPVPDSPNSPKLDLVATFSGTDESVLGLLYLRQPSPVHPAPSVERHYRNHSTLVKTQPGFWYQSLKEGRAALKKARDSIKNKCIPECRTGDFDSRYNVLYVEAEGRKGWIRYRPLTDSWKTLTFHDDASMANTDLTGNVPADVAATTSMPCSRKRPAPDDQEAGTSGASAGVPPVTGDQEGRVPDASHRTAPEIPAKRSKSSNGEEVMPGKSKRKNAKQRLKSKIRDRMAKFYPHLEWGFDRPGEMSVRFEVNTEPSSEEDSRKMMEIKDEIKALFEQLKPGSSVELPNPKLP